MKLLDAQQEFVNRYKQIQELESLNQRLLRGTWVEVINPSHCRYKRKGIITSAYTQDYRPTIIVVACVNILVINEKEFLQNEEHLQLDEIAPLSEEETLRLHLNKITRELKKYAM